MRALLSSSVACWLVASAAVSIAADARQERAARLQPWAACKAARSALSLQDGGPIAFTSRDSADGIIASVYNGGSGRWAYGTTTTLALVRGRCAAVGYTSEGGGESIVSGVRPLAVGGAARPSLTELAAIGSARLVERPEQVDDPQLAAARLAVQLADEGEHEPPREAAWPIQPMHPGHPHGSPASLWTPDALAHAQVKRPWRANEDGERFIALRLEAVRDPVVVGSHGRWELWEIHFRARLGGGLLAVYDRTTDQHRWLWGTDYDNGPQHHERFDTRAEGDTLVLTQRFDDRRIVWRIDLATGAVTRSRGRPGAERSARP